MATKFPKFSQALAQDPATRRIWYGIATAHDLEAHDAGNLFHVAWQGNFEQWVVKPLKTRPIAHAIWDPHFGESALKAFSKGWLHLQPKFRPSLSWFKNNESRLNHHLSGLLGVSSLAWTGHIVHVAIPVSRGVHVGWDNFLTTPPHPAGLTPFFTGNWTAYAENPDSASHVYGTSEGAGHMYRTNFGIGHNMKEILDAHRPPGGRLGAGALDARGSKLMPDKKDFGYSFPCDGPGRGGTCDISAWDAFYLAMFWMLNTIGWVTFYWHWKHMAIWGGNPGQFDESSNYIMVWAHERTPLANLIRWRDKPVALSIVQARLVGLVHFSVGYILTYAAFLIASTSGKFG
eukprot:scaffold11076_cov5385-Chaetoceros_neogracile.AAC.13